MITLQKDQAEFLELMEECRHDPEKFAKKILGLQVNHSQKRWFRLIRPGENGWEWRLKVLAHVAANQIGKTLGLAVLILWVCWYKIGVPTTDQKAWEAAPYTWFHLAPSQNQAYLVLNDMRLLLAGSHPAQTGKSILPPGLIKEIKIEHYYDGLEFWNGAYVQFRTTEEKAKALQGRRAAGISYDEAAFEDHLKSVVNETLFMRLIASGGPLILVSTPNGINDFFEVVQSIVDRALPRAVAAEGDWELGGSCKIGEPIPIWETDDRWILIWSTVEDNVGFGISEEEWHRMERDLDPATKEQQLRGAFLEPAEAYFVPSTQIAKAFRKLPDYQEPLPGHLYVISWDPSATTDPTVAIVLDVTKKPWKGVAFKYWPKPQGETKLLMEIFALHALYNGGGMKLRPGQRRPSAMTVIDGTSMGGALLAQAISGLAPRRIFNLAGPTTKKVALTNLRAALNRGELFLPDSWTVVRREVLTYKLPDDKIKQDTVMALLGAADTAAKGFSGFVSAKFSPHGRISRGR